MLVGIGIRQLIGKVDALIRAFVQTFTPPSLRSGGGEVLAIDGKTCAASFC